MYQGEYDLTVPSNTWHIREMRLGDKVVDTKTEGILVKDDVPLPELTVVVDSQVTTVSGILTDESGAPQPGIDVILMSQSTKRQPDGWLHSGTTGLDGRYRITDVIPGEYWMLAWPRAAVWELRDPHIFGQIESETTPVHVGASPVTQDLKLTSKTNAVAERVKTNSIFPATKY